MHYIERCHRVEGLFIFFFCMCVLSLKISTAAPPCVFRLQTYVAQVKEFSCGASHAKTKSIWWSEPRKTPSKKLENAHTFQEWLLQFQTSIMIVSSRRPDGLFLVPQLFKVFPLNLFFEHAAKAWAPGSGKNAVVLMWTLHCRHPFSWLLCLSQFLLLSPY